MINLNKWILFIIRVITVITFALTLAYQYLIFKLLYHFIIHLFPSFLWVFIEYLLGFVILVFQEVINILNYLSSGSVTERFTINHLRSFFVLHFKLLLFLVFEKKLSVLLLKYWIYAFVYWLKVLVLDWCIILNFYFFQACIHFWRILSWVVYLKH